MDAIGFCDWLAGREIALGVLKLGQTYRLPTDAEWSAAVGTSKYPWGEVFPPPTDAGNYAGEEAVAGDWREDAGHSVIKGHVDPFPYTSPVGAFKPNAFGLFDMGGNLWEWCDQNYRPSLNQEEALKTVGALNNPHLGDSKVLRGGWWFPDPPVYLLTSFRMPQFPMSRSEEYGFRCVLAGVPNP